MISLLSTRSSNPTHRLLIAAVAAICLAVPSVLWCTSFEISDTSDGLAVDGNCTLRDALYAAQSNSSYDQCPAGSTGPDRITLTQVNGTYNFDEGLHVISAGGGPLIIQGPTDNRADAIVTMRNMNRLIHMNAGSDDLTVRHLTLAYGQETTGMGGVFNVIDSSLTLENVAITNSSSESAGGAISFDADRAADDSLVISACAFSSNDVTGTWPRGGVIDATVSGTGLIRIVDSEFSGNTLNATSTEGGMGGALRIFATGEALVEISRCQFANNAIAIGSDKPNQAAGLYLRVDSTTQVSLSDCHFTDNLINVPASSQTAQVGGAVLYGEDDSVLTADRLVFDGNLAANVSGSAASRQLEVRGYDNASLTISNALVVNGLVGVKTLQYQSSQIDMSYLTATENDIGITISVNDTAALGLYNSIAWSNLLTDLNSDLGVTEADNLIGVEPHFVNPGAGDYTLQAISPAVGAADVSHPGSNTSFDLSHAPRVVGSDPDQGAYERGGLFADDFESGDTGAWSSTAG